MWSAVVARELGIITPDECTWRVRQTLRTLLADGAPRAERHVLQLVRRGDSGKLLRKLARHSEPRCIPFVSSVDNGWLGAALWVVRTRYPGRPTWLDALFDRMRWDAFYNPNAPRPGGLLHGGFFTQKYGHDRPGGVYLGTHIGGEDVWLTTHHYDTIVSETRITSYLGIMTGQVPAQHYFAAWRTFPATCDWSWHEMQPVGVTRNYLGLDVYEGAYTYRGMHIVPGWGGSMFEELMPNVFVPEEDVGPALVG